LNGGAGFSEKESIADLPLEDIQRHSAPHIPIPVLTSSTIFRDKVKNLIPLRENVKIMELNLKV
jgi:hypothetical protein